MINLNQHKAKNHLIPIIKGYNLNLRLLVLTAIAIFFPFSLFGTGLQIDQVRFNDSVVSSNLVIEKRDSNKAFYFEKLYQVEISLLPDSSLVDTFFYQLASIDTAWHATPYPFIRYTNLPAAKHNLFIYQSGKKDTISLQFGANYLAIDNSVPWWLQALLVFCLLLIPFTIVYFITLNRW